MDAGAEKPSRTTLTREDGYRSRVRLDWHLERRAAGEELP
jgi:hypothetical protein